MNKNLTDRMNKAMFSGSYEQCAAWIQDRVNEEEAF